jgi:hypothetical protein
MTRLRSSSYSAAGPSLFELRYQLAWAGRGSELKGYLRGLRSSICATLVWPVSFRLTN